MRSPEVEPEWARVGAGDSNRDGDLPSSCFSDVWQRWRFHMNSASAPGTPDGYIEWRRVDLLDPDKILPATCARTSGRIYQLFQGDGVCYDPTVKGCITEATAAHNDGFDNMLLAYHMNGGPWGESQWYRFGPIRVWNSDPGWGW